MNKEINYEIDNCITDLDTLIILDKRAMKDVENNTHEIEQQEVLTIIREFIRLKNDYEREKEKNKELEKFIKEGITDEKILNYINILVNENNRLEDIEDKKVQIEYNLVFNKGKKSVEEKIKEKIKELEKEYKEYENSPEWEIFDETKYAYELLKELLEEGDK